MALSLHSTRATPRPAARRPAHTPQPMTGYDGLRRAHPSALPVTGAWRPGDPAGHRRFLSFPAERPFALEGGGLLRGVTVAYETWGELDPDGGNAVLVCHALTGDSHAVGPLATGHPSAGWWEGAIGPGRMLDTDRWFVVCVNVLGGCQGSTGPASPHPDDGKPWGSRFPVVTVRDMVRTQVAVADRLGVSRWALVVGGSMGGMQALEWAVMHPERVGAVVPIATAAAASAAQIGWWSSGRRAIRDDPRFRDGDYYDAAPGEGPHRGMGLARRIGHISYRTEAELDDRFGHGPQDREDPLAGGRYAVESYLDHQADQLVRRFDANSYLLLTKAMDLHDLGRGRGGMEAAFARLRAPLLSVGISSDILYPPHQSREIVSLAAAAGVLAEYAELDSPHGHDAFLIEVDALTAVVRSFIDRLDRGELHG